MWVMFASAVFVGVLFLYLPGFLLIRAFRLPGLTALVCAPLVSIPAYVVLCLLYAQAGVFVSWPALFVPLLACGVVALAVGFLAGRGKAVRLEADCFPAGAEKRGTFPFAIPDWTMLGLYVGVGLVIATLCFVSFLGDPDSFIQAYDNVHHLGSMRGFLESGNWSPFASTSYATAADAAIDPLPGTGFYPTAWHTLAALLASALGVSPMLAANAVNFLFVAVVLPASMFLLMKAVFPGQPGALAAGALCVLGFSAFPWMLISFGPLFPNMIAFCMVPAVAFCFMALFAPVGRGVRAAAAVLFCFGIACCAFSQPNAVFTAAVFLAPFCVYQAVRAADRLPVAPGHRRLVKVACGIAACLAICAIWFALYRAPFLQGVVSHSWPAVYSKPHAIFSALTVGYRAVGTQIALAALVIVGMLATLRQRQLLWLSFSYAIMALMFAVSVSSDGPLQHLLTGFWYTDSFRTAASAALFAIPLASLGLWTAVRWCASLAGKARPQASYRNRVLACACAASAVLVLANYAPGLSVPVRSADQPAFTAVLNSLRQQNDPTVPDVYANDERAFVQRVEEVVPPGEVVLNIPDDGSALAYGVDGLRVYYRYLRIYGTESETEQSTLIRTRLASVATDDRVKEAVRSVGAHYVLLLDNEGPASASPRFFTYEGGENWKGAEAVSDDTPGFEVVLSEGDMRLYRITAV